MPGGRDPDAVVYPGAPLRAVAVELTFQPLLDARTRFAAFQRRHLRDFSRVLDAPGDDGERVGRQDDREFSRPESTLLMASNRERAVSVARDRLSVITYVYDTGFTGFVTWATPLLREGLADLGVEQLRAVSYRYENRIAHDTRDVELGSLFRLSLAAPPEAGATTRHVHLYWQQRWPNGTVEVALNACPNVSVDLIHLNITSHCETRSTTLHQLEQQIRDSRRLARLTFENLITPSFRDSLQSA